MQARIDQIDDMCCGGFGFLCRCSTEIMRCSTPSLLARWPNEDDRPADFDEVVSINDGYQEFGVDYVRY